MKHKFLAGAIAGIGSLALAIPILAQFSYAQTNASSSPSTMEDKMMFRHRTLTQAEVQEMAANEQKVLDNLDAIVAIHKTALQAHHTALVAAAAITDDTERMDALKKAHEDMRTSIQTAIQANPDLQNMKMMMPFGGHGKMMGHRGPKMEMLSEKLGMTEEELKAAIDSGKTIQEIAEEKGIDLPAPPMKGMHGGTFMEGAAPDTPAAENAAQ